MKFIKILKSIYRKFFCNYFILQLQKELSDCKSVLDLGCGPNSPLQYCNVTLKVGVDWFEPYLEESKKKKIHNQYIKADITEIEFQPQSFDAVVALDVLEHLEKEKGYELLKKMEKWARKKIIIFTPNGYISNDCIDNNPLQEHKSGWEFDDFKNLGFKIYGMNGWKKLRGPRTFIKYKPRILWTIISDITQSIVYYYPKLAFHLFAVKKTYGTSK
jgi:SAM-dependent methyltransferase